MPEATDRIGTGHSTTDTGGDPGSEPAFARALEYLRRWGAGWAAVAAGLEEPGEMDHIPPREDISVYEMRLSPRAANVMLYLGVETGDVPAEVIRKALGLYKVAIDARKRGETVGAAEDPEALDTVFGGL